jgi:hypothetical protein
MLPSASTAQGFSVWRAEYFANPNLTGQPLLERYESALNHAWQDNSPDASIPSDGFSARWMGYFLFDEGTYSLKAYVDHGLRLWVDGQLLVDQWANQVETLYERQVDLATGYHSLLMEYRHTTGRAVVSLSWEPQLGPLVPNRWRAEYFNSLQPTGQPVWTREETTINHDWGMEAPAPNVVADGFSIRWTGNMDFVDDSYVFTVTADDDVRVWVDGKLLIERLEGEPESTVSAVRRMTQGAHPIVVEYSDRSAVAAIRFLWQREAEARPTPTPTPILPPALPNYDPNFVFQFGGPNEGWYERSIGYKGNLLWEEAISRTYVVTIRARPPSICVTGGTPSQSTITVAVTDQWYNLCPGEVVTYAVEPAIATLSTYRGALDESSSHSAVLTSGSITGTVWVTVKVDNGLGLGVVAVQITGAQ